MSTVVPPYSLWRSGDAISRFNASPHGTSLLNPKFLRSNHPRAALVEARPRALPAVNGDTSLPTQLVLAVDRTDDLQAEARAMARAANAPFYSPDLIANTYGSRPIEVFFAQIALPLPLPLPLPPLEFNRMS